MWTGLGFGGLAVFDLSASVNCGRAVTRVEVALLLWRRSDDAWLVECSRARGGMSAKASRCTLRKLSQRLHYAVVQTRSLVWGRNNMFVEFVLVLQRPTQEGSPTHADAKGITRNWRQPVDFKETLTQ